MKIKNLTTNFSKCKFLLLLFCSSLCLTLSAQSKKTIHGRVTDTKGEPVIGVSILEAGTTNGTTTDMDGTFSFSAGNGSTLTFSSLGYETFRLQVNDKTSFNVVLKDNDKILNEVVVVGYGVMRKKDLTGSLASVGSKAMQDKPVANIGEALQGRASGVMITNSGAPGDNVAINIRGLGTINDSSPLLVIDGVPTDLGLNALNPNDVESVDVLKDASATAIYGSRGANGVILITTKKGKESGSLSFSSNWGVQQANSIPKMMNARQFASMHNEMMFNGGLTQRPDFANPLLWEGNSTDWLDAMLQTGVMQNYSLSYSRGNDKVSNYVSGSVLEQKGIVINTNYRRFTFQFNNQTQVLSWLKFGNNLTLSHDIKKKGSYDVLNAMRALPTQPILNDDGTYSGPGDQATWYGDIRNPIGSAKLEKNETRGYNLLGNVYAEATILKKVVVKSLGGVDYKDWTSESFSPKYNWKPIAVPASSRSEQWNRSLTLLWDNTATYTDVFNEKHSITAMIGSSAQTNQYRYMNGSIQSFLSDNYNQLDNGLLKPLVGGSTSEWALLSFFGRANYSYDNKYLLTATVRRDGTSRLSKENRWGTFPSFSAAWRFTEEHFYKQNAIFSDGKLRLGYGETGNQAPLDTYAYVTRLKTSQYVFNGTAVSTLYPLVMPSPNVKWETVKQWNAGLDISFFQQRINLTFDAYIKNTSNMLVPMMVPITTGYSDTSTPQINAGKVQNKGWELNVSSRNLTGALKWTTDANVSYNRNKVVKLDGNTPIYYGYQTHTVGKPIGAFFGYVTNGLFQNQAEVNNYALQIAGGTAPGDIKFKDLDNDGVINEHDRTFLGNPTPSWIFSMNNNFTYKDFDFELFFQGVAGNDIYNANRVSLEGMSTVVNQTIKVLDRWTGEGTSNSIPRAVYADPNNNNRNSNRFIEDGSYLRLKNVKLGYTIPERLTKKLALSNAHIYFSGQNLFTLTKYSGFDPEVSGGVDSGNYPLTRTFSMGVDIRF